MHLSYQIKRISEYIHMESKVLVNIFLSNHILYIKNTIKYNQHSYWYNNFKTKNKVSFKYIWLKN